MIEQKLGAPVLGVQRGKVLDGERSSLAVLHPSCLAIYDLAQQGGAYTLTKEHEHPLDHTAHSMVTGNFGGGRGVEQVCVQTMDGQLVFFSGKRRLFHRYLVNFLVPGPLCYVPGSDSFVTGTSALGLELYTYQGLSDATSGETKVREGGPGSVPGTDAGDEGGGRGQQGTRGKEVAPRWSVTLGEGVMEVRCAPSLSGGGEGPEDSGLPDLVVLGERHLFVVSLEGRVKGHVKLDYHPMAVAVVPTPAAITGVNYHVMVSAHTGNVMLYRGSRLVWSAKADLVPICLSTAAVGGIEGMIVATDDRARCEVLYLGTDPPLSVVQVMDSKDDDFEAMDAEHQELLARIREHTSGDDRRAAVMNEPRLHLRTNVPLVCDVPEASHVALNDPLAGDPGGGFGGGGTQARQVTATVHLSFEGRGSARDVVVHAACPATVECATGDVEVGEVFGSRATPVTLRLVFTHSGATVPPNNVVTVTAAYATDRGEPRAAVATMRLPMTLFAELVPPIKEAAYKLVIDTNRAPPQLTSLFDDMVSQSTSLASTVSANVMSMRYACGSDATVVVSRQGGRYKIQSDSFHPMWLLTDELCTRLRALFAGSAAPRSDGEEPFRISFLEPLPLGDLFEAMDRHLETRRALGQLTGQLEQRATQFRSVQKRLLVRFKDRNPEPLKHLDELLSVTYRQLVELGRHAQELAAEVAVRRWEMCGALRLILLLSKLQYGLAGDAAAALDAFLSPDALDARETSWEQVAQASIQWALARQEGHAVHAGELQPVEDTGELKRLISALMTRLAEAPGSFADL